MRPENTPPPTCFHPVVRQFFTGYFRANFGVHG
jgi:hypothetical protein